MTPSAAPGKPDEIARRFQCKIKKVEEGAQKWVESGCDPSPIGQALQEKFKPPTETGKVKEAEAELDRVLEQLDDGGEKDGTDVRELPVAPFTDRIASLGRDPQSRQQLFTIWIDGTKRRQLTFADNNSMPSWSPGGAHLVYVARTTTGPKITIMDEDFGNKRELVIGYAPDLGNRRPDRLHEHQPDRADAWRTVRDHCGECRRRGAAPGDLCRPPRRTLRLSWSQDDRRLVFMQLTPQDPATDDTVNGCHTLPVRAELWIINADGTNPRLLTPTGFSNYDASGQLINSASDASVPD